MRRKNSFVEKVDADRFVDYMNRSLDSEYYSTHYAEYSSADKEISRIYATQAQAMTTAEIETFCAMFASDTAAMKKIGVIQTIQRHIDFRTYHSPPEEAPENLQMLGFLTIFLLQAVPTAQGFSQVSSGNYGAASQSFSFANNVSTATSSVSGTYNPKRCKSFGNFPTVSDKQIDFTWDKYQSIMSCV